MLLSDGGAPQPPVFLLSAEPVPPPVAAVAHAAPAVVATPREDTDVDVEDKAADHHIYNMDAIEEARSQVRSGTITTFKHFNATVGKKNKDDGTRAKTSEMAGGDDDDDDEVIVLRPRQNTPE